MSYTNWSEEKQLKDRLPENEQIISINLLPVDVGFCLKQLKMKVVIPNFRHNINVSFLNKMGKTSVYFGPVNRCVEILRESGYKVIIDYEQG